MFLIGINYIKTIDFFEGNENQFLLWILATCWIDFKYLSFIDKIDGNHNSDILVDFSYFFYFPMLFIGPSVGFLDFQMILCEGRDFRSRFFLLMRNLLPFCFWLLFIEVSLNFFYVSAYGFQYEPPRIVGLVRKNNSVHKIWLVSDASPQIQ